MRVQALLIGLVFAAAAAVGQQAPPPIIEPLERQLRELEERAARAIGTPVYVSHAGSDSVGSRVAHEVRELLRASKGFPLVRDESLAVLRLELITTPACGDESDPTSGAMSVVLTTNEWPARLIHARVMVTGRTRVSDTAADVVAGIDRAVEDLRKRLRER